MFDPLSMALLGGGIGLLGNRQNPLKGAAMGAAAGGLGSQMAGLFNNVPLDGSSIVDLSGSGLEGLTQTQPDGLLGTIKEYQPMMSAAATGLQTANSLMPQKQPIQAQAPTQSTGGAQNLSNLYAELAQQSQPDQMAEQERRMRRMNFGGMR